jgi:hypothetical protein
MTKAATLETRARSWGLRYSTENLLYGAALVAAMSAWYWACRSVNTTHVGDTGLIPNLSPAWWVSVFAVLFLNLFLLTSDLSRRWFPVATIALVVVVHATATIAESHPRFPTAYFHAGLSTYIAESGKTLPRLNAQMSWPGMFAGAGMLARAMGVLPRWFLQWNTVAMEFVYLFPVKALANHFLGHGRASWLALWLFTVGAWVGQDYFSPQAVNLLIYLTVIALAVKALGRSRQDADTRTSSWDLWMFATVLLLILGSVASHQLTPIALVAVLFGLAVFRQTRLRWAWLVTAIAATAWLCWVALPYWSGHLGDIFGSVGSVGSNLNQNVGSRLHGSAGRLLVLRSRVAAAAALWVVAALAGVIAWRSRSYVTRAIIIFGAPFCLLVAQSYGGEAIQRVYLFTLAPAAILIASLLNASSFRAVKVLPIAALVALVVIFPLARWGNERFEAVTRADLRALDWAYAHAPAGSTFVALSPLLPWGYRNLSGYHLTPSANEFILATEGSVTSLLAKNGKPTLVIVTRGQQAYGEEIYGLKKGWAFELEKTLIRSGLFRKGFRSGSSVVLVSTRSAERRAS